MDEKVVAIGIDLGTTYSCVAVWQKDQVEIIPNDQGLRITPSCVSFTEGGRLIGEGAKNKIISNATNTIYDAKRLIGRRFSDTKVEEDMKSWPFKVIKGTNDIPHIVVEYNGEKKEIPAEQISSMILRKLKEDAEEFLGTTVIDAVITVPAYFDDSQRQATKDAGQVAGLNVLQIINEPTSAAIAYGLDNKTDITHDTNVLIFDLGGGTFDVSLVTIDKNCTVKVNAVAGDTHLGGQDFDKVMVDHFVEQFNKKHKTNMSENGKALARLRIECEKAKRVLSLDTQTDIEIACLHDGIDFSMRITRAKFESLNRDFFSKCIGLVESCLGDAKMNKKDVDEVVLVGGSTRIPKVQELLKAFFNGKELSKRIHVDEAVAYGAAVLAAKLGGSYSLKVKHLELVDVVPLSLGVRTLGDVFNVMIKRNSQIPAEKEAPYFTVKDNQSSITFNVYQGERSIASENNWLGSFSIAVPQAPKGESKVKVVFKIDVDGILNCSGEEVTTGLTKQIRITPDKQRLSNEDIKKMLLDAQKYKLEDEEFKKKIFARNALDDYIYKVNSKIEGNKKSIGKKDMEKMEKEIVDAQEFLSGSKLADVDEYEKTLNMLEKLCFPILARHV